VHRIGRTGRCGKTGIATTFINKDQSETTLLDLKHLLREAKQRVPPVLTLLNDPLEAIEAAAAANGTKGCAFCGGLGHRITDCPKLATYKAQQLSTSTRKDYLGTAGFGAEVRFHGVDTITSSTMLTPCYPCRLNCAAISSTQTAVGTVAH